MLKELTPQEVHERLTNGEPMTVIDVRESWELAICRLERAQHIPMGEIPEAPDRIPRQGTVVIMCHKGGRSAQVTRWLTEQGFTNVYNMAGGIDRWAVEVDPSLARY
jgi:rhodanese-related sulfurtransferase